MKECEKQVAHPTFEYIEPLSALKVTHARTVFSLEAASLRSISAPHGLVIENANFTSGGAVSTGPVTAQIKIDVYNDPSRIHIRIQDVLMTLVIAGGATTVIARAVIRAKKWDFFLVDEVLLVKALLGTRLVATFSRRMTGVGAKPSIIKR